MFTDDSATVPLALDSFSPREPVRLGTACALSPQHPGPESSAYIPLQPRIKPGTFGLLSELHLYLVLMNDRYIPAPSMWEREQGYFCLVYYKIIGTDSSAYIVPYIQ
jgi:hypothetical protein